MLFALRAVMTQSMAFSPYKKPFEERLLRWEAQLSLVSEVIDEWLALQRAWMYLEPIFSSPDILQQLPQEGKKYSSVDRIWRKVLHMTKQPTVQSASCCEHDGSLLSGSLAVFTHASGSNQVVKDLQCLLLIC